MSIRSKPKPVMETREIKWALTLLKEKKQLSFSGLEEWRNGVLLITTLELITNKTIGKYYKTPKNRIQMIENINIALTFMTANNILAKCSPQDFVDGNDKAIQSTIYRMYLVANGKSVHQSSSYNLLNHQNSSTNINNYSYQQNHNTAISPSNSQINLNAQQPQPPPSPSFKSSSSVSSSPSSSSSQLDVSQPAPAPAVPTPTHSTASESSHPPKPKRPTTSPPSLKVLMESLSPNTSTTNLNTYTTSNNDSNGYADATQKALDSLDLLLVNTKLEKEQQVIEEQPLPSIQNQHLEQYAVEEEVQEYIKEQAEEEYVDPDQQVEQIVVAVVEDEVKVEIQLHQQEEQPQLTSSSERETELNITVNNNNQDDENNNNKESSTETPHLPDKSSLLSKSGNDLLSFDPEQKWKRRLLNGRPMSGSGFNIGRARNSFIDPTSTSSARAAAAGSSNENSTSNSGVTSDGDASTAPTSPIKISNGGVPISNSSLDTLGGSPSLSQLSSSPMSWSMAKIEVSESDKPKRKKPLLLKQNPIDLERYNNPDLLPAIIKSQSYARRWLAMRKLKRRIKFNIHRNKCFKEILSSEENYVSAIEMIVKVFYQQIVFNTKVSPTPYLTQDQINTIFSTVNEIYSFNTELLSRLRDRAKDWSQYQKIGDIFVVMAPYLKLYKTYCLNYDNAIECLQKAKKNEKFSMFIKACLDHPENPMKQSLESLLITVVQRIPRYILLIQDMAKNTWEDHIDFDSLNMALKHVQLVANEVNSSIKMAESQSKVLAIQRSLIGWDDSNDLVNPSRHFIKQGIIYQCHLDSRFAKDLQEMFYFAFNDSILIAEKKDSTKYQFKYFFELSKTRVKDVDDSQVLQNAIHLISGENTAMVSFHTPQLKKNMIEFIEKGKNGGNNSNTNNNSNNNRLTMVHQSSINDLIPQSEISDLKVGEGPYNVQIKKTESKKIPGKKPFTVYIIDIVNESTGDVFSISRRYSDFDSLHKKLKRKFPDADIRDLPKKHLINSLGTNTVESRRVMLEVFLQDLFQKENIKNSRYLLNFISKEDSSSASSSKSLKKKNSESQLDGADQVVLTRQKSKDDDLKRSINDFIDYESTEEEESSLNSLNPIQQSS